MSKLMQLLLITAALLVTMAPAKAHFIQIHVIHGAQPRIEFHFCEGAWDFTEAEMMFPYLERMHAFLPGVGDLAFRRTPYGMVADLPEGQTIVAADLTVGVMNRGGDNLLEYGAKGIAGIENGNTSAGLRTEIMVEVIEGDRLAITVLHDGKPAPHAEITVPVAGSAITEELETDARGRIVIARPRTPLYSMRAKVAEIRAGEHDGKKFDEIHHWTTLTVHDHRGRLPEGSDGLAWALLEDARLCDGVQGHGPSVTARFAGAIGAESLRGEVVVADGKADFGKEEVPAAAIHCIRDDVAGLCSGKLIDRGTDAVEMGPFEKASHSRAIIARSGGKRWVIVDRRLVQIDERCADFHKQLRVVSSRLSHEDRFLPENFVVTRFDPRNGAITEVEMHHRKYVETDAGQVISKETIESIGRHGSSSTRTVSVGGRRG